jgi:DNA-binding response OmpR family regulator
MTAAVLIVDDSLTVRMDLHDAFQASGFHPIACASVADARAALTHERVEAIVLDVLLPDGDGVDFLEELRDSPDHRAKAILLLSTEAEVRDRVRGLRTGADDYVGKPYDTGYVVAKVRELTRTDRAADGHAPTVLVIEDSLTFRTELTRALEAEGYTVLTAATGEEGLREAADQRPDALIVDGMLPGLDGATVIRRVRLDAALRDTPCLLMTASADGDTELRVLEAGADAFVHKSDNVAIVVAKVGAILRSSVGTAPSARTSSLHGPKRILAVDDSPTYLNRIGGCLRDEGYEVVLARSGEEALDLLANQVVDCILLDLLMPGIGGRETCHRIKGAPALRDIPLIMITALDDPDAMLAGLRTGADDYIHKTDQLDVLKARVEAQIRRKQSHDETRRIREQLLRTELEAAEARAAHEMAAARAAHVEELEAKNQDLEAFSYSVSHDLRNPIHIIDALAAALTEDYGDRLGETGQRFLRQIHDAAQRMNDLVNALLRLSHVSRTDITRDEVDLTALVRRVVDDLRLSEPAREASFTIEERMVVRADRELITILVENLLGNAWKYTRRTPATLIEVGSQIVDDRVAHFVRDNGAGFSMDNAGTLFLPYRRLHSDVEFPGSGIGLATVQRIVDKHGGRIWAHGEVGVGAVFYFTT